MKIKNINDISKNFKNRQNTLKHPKEPKIKKTFKYSCKNQENRLQLKFKILRIVFSKIPATKKLPSKQPKTKEMKK